jgi:hypothetical protein
LHGRTKAAHGDRYLATRLFVKDGRILERINPGLADLENEWREIGGFSDLTSALADLRRAGWTAQRVASRPSYIRLASLIVLVALISAVSLAAAGPAFSWDSRRWLSR